MEQTQQYISEMINSLTAVQPLEKVSGFFDLKKYIGTNYDVLGISVPTQRLLFKTGYSFSTLPIEDQLAIWDHIWKQADVYEVLSQCIYFIEKNLEKFEAGKVWKVLMPWVLKIDNWAHSDGLSTIYARLMAKIPDEIYLQFQSWNTSENPWERRQSLVGMLIHSKRQKLLLPASKLLDLVEPLLYDKDYFVQKGIGWALREIGNIYPDQTMAFLDHYCRILSPPAFATATEKISATAKDVLKQKRKIKINRSQYI